MNVLIRPRWAAVAVRLAVPTWWVSVVGSAISVLYSAWCLAVADAGPPAFTWLVATCTASATFVGVTFRRDRWIAWWQRRGRIGRGVVRGVDLGLLRDSTLHRTSEIQLFPEERHD